MWSRDPNLRGLAPKLALNPFIASCYMAKCLVSKTEARGLIMEMVIMAAVNLF